SGNIQSMSIAALRTQLAEFEAAAELLRDVPGKRAAWRRRKKLGRIEKLKRELEAKQARKIQVMEKIHVSDTAKISALEAEVRDLKRLVTQMAGKMGMAPPPEQAEALKPTVNTIAAQAARGVSVLEQFKIELFRHLDAGKSWDQSIDHISETLFKSAASEFAL